MNTGLSLYIRWRQAPIVHLKLQLQAYVQVRISAITISTSLHLGESDAAWS